MNKEINIEITKEMEDKLADEVNENVEREYLANTFEGLNKESLYNELFYKADTYEYLDISNIISQYIYNLEELLGKEKTKIVKNKIAYEIKAKSIG